MNAEIIAVGTELLLGQIVNTNAKFLSEQLAEIGVNVYFHTVVGDNPDRLKQAITTAEERADVIIFTGGLGPTKDDLTKETIAGHLGKQLVTDGQAMKTITDYFKKTDRKMSENNKKQALVIEGADVLPNEHGMAPGMFVADQAKYYILLPGPPHEMQPMFRKYGREAIIDKLEATEKIESRVLRFFGIGESQLEEDLAELIDSQSNPTIAPLAGDGEVTIRITAREKTSDRAKALLDQAEHEILQISGDYFYGYEDTSLMRELLKELESKNLTIAASESLTGGLFQSEMTSVVGVSTMLIGGIVCYSNKVKVELCQVKKETLENHGAVSEQCAQELADNIREMMDTDFGISFTGAAGPDSLEGHAPGSVWIGISMKGKETKTYFLRLSGSRNGNRKKTVQYGCFYLLKELRSWD